MKVSFLTSLFYVAATTPSFCEFWDLPIIKPIEAQAWSVLLLTSGLLGGLYSDRWAANRNNTVQEKKISE